MREFAALARLGEAVGRHAPRDAITRCWYAQALIETGQATAAIDVLRPLATRLPRSDRSWPEAQGLIGRANKQIFFDATDKHSIAAREALKQSLAAYRAVLDAPETQSAWTWQGINVVAVLAAARRLRVRVAPGVDPVAMARRVIDALNQVPEESRDEWHAATAAEAHLALRDWDSVALHLRAYVTSPKVTAFHLASTLRQFTEVWGLGTDAEHGRPLLGILQAQLMRKPGGILELNPAAMDQLTRAPEPERGQLEAILGDDGPRTYRWMLLGLERARSVAAIELRGIRRHGTGFLMRARDLGLVLDELVVVTNHHVVNDEGSGEAIRPESTEVVFEATSPPQRLEVDKVLWQSPTDRHDVSILKLKSQPSDLKPLSPAGALPVIDEPQRVYVIGYPGGRELAFSLQDNELLDHEAPPKGKPPIAGVVRLHYRAPTEGGSSGSPVFNDEWNVIGLHHLGGKSGVSRLNGTSGTYAANEGLWIQAIIGESK
jgi:S1-C subfamily serine protease